jgi:hypothetical protein
MSRRTGPPSYARRPAAPTRRLVPLVVALGAVAALLGGAIGYSAGRPDATTAAVDELRAAEQRRDVVQIQELTSVARTTRVALEPLLADLDAALDGSGPAPSADVAGWRTNVAGLVERHADSPSGTTATNVARGAFRTALTDLAIAVDLYATTSGLPAAQRPAVVEQVRRLRTAATVAWSVAATQLDQINVEAGLGHQHVFLPGAPGSGAFTSDDAPEGRPGS